MMQEWLTRRGEQAPDQHAHHAHGATLMPGHVHAGRDGAPRGRKGRSSTALFLEFMIKHHEGALTMVKELFSKPGAGQEADIFAFASDVDADQRMEIDRMGGAMLKELQK